MAQVSLWGAVYPDVPAIELPDGEGGTSTFYENGGGDIPEANPGDVTFIDYDGTVVASYTADEIKAIAETAIASATRITPTNFDITNGWVSYDWWWHESNVNNFSDVYAVQSGHTYFLRLESSIGNAFKAIILSTNPAASSEDIYGTPVYNKSNPVPYEGVVFTAGSDGYLVVTKDHNYGSGIPTYLYDASEIDTPSSLPSNPSHSGLTAQGWNYSLSQIYCEVVLVGRCLVGQLYTTVDGWTRIYVEVPYDWDSDRRVAIRMKATSKNDATIYWGDGSLEHVAQNSITTFMRTYQKPGKYVIEIDPGEDGIEFWGSGSSDTSGYSIWDSRAYAYWYRSNFIYKVEIGDKVKQIGQSTFFGCRNLETITIPKELPSMGTYVFRNCNKLKAFVSPLAIGTYNFYYCYNLKYVSMPSGATSIPSYAFYYCYTLKSVSIPSTVTDIGTYAFMNCIGLESVVLPEGITSIGTQAFNSCRTIAKIHMKPTAPPTLTNSNALTNIASDCKIYVPYSEDHSILEAYKTASNWTSHASKMLEESA